MFDDFYLDINLNYFYKYIILNQKQYKKDHILCYVTDDNEYGRFIRFDLKDCYGEVILWNTGIIEEQIFNNDNHDLLFYLHYKLVNMKQCTTLFHEFYHALQSQVIIPPIKILLCCSGGLTTSLFAQKLQELAKLEKANIEINAVGYHQLNYQYQDYQAIYLAPQIAYLEPQILFSTHQKIPIYLIAPLIYATQNYRALLNTIQENIEKDA